MAHPKREKYALELQKELGCKIIWDKENNCLETRIRCLEDHTGDYGITLQDDCLTEHFKDKAERLIDGKYDIYNFYYSEWAATKPCKKVEGGVILDRLKNELCFAIRKELIPGLIKYCKAKYEQGHTKDWVMQYHLGEAYYPLPSIVDHRGLDSLLVKNAKKTRRYNENGLRGGK